MELCSAEQQVAVQACTHAWGVAAEVQLEQACILAEEDVLPEACRVWAQTEALVQAEGHTGGLQCALVAADGVLPVKGWVEGVGRKLGGAVSGLEVEGVGVRTAALAVLDDFS